MTSPTWTSDEPPPRLRPGALGWTLVVIRGAILALLIFGCLGLLLLTRLVERPLFGHNRPWTPRITVFVCRNAFRVMGLPLVQTGSLTRQPGAIVANHSSWLDIFALNAAGPLYFVSKDEVARWPGIGWLARATGTVFVRRDRREARNQTALFESRIGAGHKLLFFPEGTSTDGQRVLPFKPTLFASFFSNGIGTASIQPVTVVYRPPEGGEPRFYGWWGDMSFGPHLMKILATPRQGRVEVTWHDAMPVADFENRKALAKSAETAVRSAHPMGNA